MNFLRGLQLRMLSSDESSCIISFVISDLFCNSLHVLLVLVSFVVGDAVDSEIDRLFDILFRPIATLWWIWVRVQGLQITLGFPRHACSIGSLMNPWWSECYFWSFSRCELSCEQFSLSTFADNLYDAIFWHRLVRKMFAKNLDQHLVLWTSESSTLHLLQVSNEFDTVLSWFLDICYWICFICIAVERIKRSKEDCLSSFTFLSSCHLSNFCYGVLVSCSTHVINESFPPVRNHNVIHQSWWYDHSTWMTLDRTKKISILHFHLYRFQTLSWCFKIKAMEQILVCKFFFNLTSESSFQYK